MEPFAVDFNIVTAICIPDLDTFHHIIIFRVIDTDSRFHDQSSLRLYELTIQISPMRVKRADAVRGIEIIFLVLIGDDVDSSSQSIGPQAGRNYSFIYLDPVNNIYRQIGQ